MMLRGNMNNRTIEKIEKWPLDQKMPCGYASPVTSKKGVDWFDGQYASSAKSRTSSLRLFSCQASVYGGPGGRAERLAGFLSEGAPVRQSCHGLPPILTAVVVVQVSIAPLEAIMAHNLTLGTSAIREQDGLYSLNDLHSASGALEHHRPSKYLANQQAQELIAELGKAQIRALSTKHGGRNGSQTYACRELVIAYAAWISAAFHLKVIQVFLAQHDQPKQVPALPVQPQPTLIGRRFLLTLDGGQEHITALAPSDCILNIHNISNFIRSGSTGLGRQQLADIAKACLDQLGGGHD